MGFLNKLYVRIWLAVVLAVAVLTFLVGWAWRMASEPPLREVVVRNQAGEVIGNGHRRARQPAPAPWAPIAPSPGAPQTDAPSGKPDADGDEPDANGVPPRGRYGEGPEFVVRMQDGQTVHMHMPRPPQSAWRAPFGFFWTLGLVAVAVALGTYPIVRRLTRRLETLQQGVERWGGGDLGARVQLDGQDEVGFLAQRFNHAAQQIELLVQTRDAVLASQKSLLANASHELRSPLARIRMGLELLGTQPTAAAKTEISRNIAELDQLIEEILLASRLDAQEADMGTVEPVDLVGLAAEEAARNDALLLVETQTLTVRGVSRLLRRVLRNLLENAHRYANGEVTLQLTQHHGMAIVRVSDQGPGVPEALRERIFEPFFRLPGASEGDGGVGLGLALVRAIVLRHGGTVMCIAGPHGGACFEVQLPLER
ncbi:MAG: HAMP domain-containing protein [Rhodoferax sp.]|nr:HAMP domain-containing protein [Rhodoferax sp.]